MKKIIALCMLFTMVFCGCSKKEYHMENGMYVPQSVKDGQIEVPYLLFHDQSFTIVMNIALSYQPSGTLQRQDNTVILETKYAEEDYKWVFKLTDDNTLRFDANASRIAMNQDQWTDEMVFIKAD